MNRKETLVEAQKCVCGQREEEYGSPENNFAFIGRSWTDYVNTKCRKPDGSFCIDAHDVGIMMVQLKVARIASGQIKPDNYVDGAGYFACSAEIATGNPQKATSEEFEALKETMAKECAEALCKNRFLAKQCESCPVGRNATIEQISCREYIKHFPEDAVEMMRRLVE